MKQVFKVSKAEDRSFKPEDHFTEIKFENLGPRPKNLLSVENVAKFVRGTVNLPIFEKFPWKKEVEEFLGRDQRKIEVSPWL
jgi:hypothetical protein